mmetsp:Transcript_29291/g.28447  ORF Transcript_29291/g.28447 Transcript_29291/m.28447 type:complete len:175 (+) Transcript_29291:1564-2088(+)
MRTSLYLLEKFGGALLRPAYFDYSQEMKANPDDVTQMMFGCCLMALFQTAPKQSYVKAYFPLAGEQSAVWLQLQTLTAYSFSEGGQNSILISVGPGYPLPTFQKQGSVVSLQGAAMTIQDLLDLPLELSIVYDSNGQAEGYVVVEDATAEEFYFVKTIGNIINIKQQNSGALES